MGGALRPTECLGIDVARGRVVDQAALAIQGVPAENSERLLVHAHSGGYLYMTPTSATLGESSEIELLSGSGTRTLGPRPR